MQKKLLVPDYVVAQQQAKKQAETKPIQERVPQPTGWRVLVMPYKGREKTVGGVYMPDETRDRESVATVVAYVVKVGPLAYKVISSLPRSSPPMFLFQQQCVKSIFIFLWFSGGCAF